MRCRQCPHLALRPSASRQFDLFTPATKDSGKAELPQWATLPEEKRQTLIDLLTRLLLEHANGNHHPLTEEATS
jgi:hypothetical protein